MNNRKNYKKAVDQIHASSELKEKTFEKIVEKKKVVRPHFTRYLAACAVFVAVLAVGGFYFKGGIHNEEDITKPKTVAQANNDLPRFESMEQLKEALSKNDVNNIYYKSGLGTVDMAVEETEDMESESTNTTGESDYSKTNNQVEGVDEADIVKTDGNYIYYVSQGKVYIINAQSLKIESTIESESNQNRFYPTEIFINDDKLVILGNAYVYEDVDVEDEEDDVYYNYYGRKNKHLAKAKVYNILNKKSPKVEREVALDGMYETSRMIGDNIYFISSKGVYYYNGIKDADLLPVYADTVVSKDFKSVDYSDIAYFEGTSSHSYLIVAGFDINKKEPASTETFFGASEDVYASKENLYITQSYYKYLFGNDITKSKIYKFNLKDSKVVLQASTEIKGTVNNQFSMDEYEGKLRIATTSNEYDEDFSKSQVIVLDEDLNEIGRIGNMAKGERIYSVRFIGKVRICSNI